MWAVGARRKIYLTPPHILTDRPVTCFLIFASYVQSIEIHLRTSVHDQLFIFLIRANGTGVRNNSAVQLLVGMKGGTNMSNYTNMRKWNADRNNTIFKGIVYYLYCFLKFLPPRPSDGSDCMYRSFPQERFFSRTTL